MWRSHPSLVEMQDDAMDLSQLSPQMSLHLFDGSALPDIGLLWDDDGTDRQPWETLSTPTEVSHALPSHEVIPDFQARQGTQGFDSSHSRECEDAPVRDHVAPAPAPRRGRPRSKPGRYTTTPVPCIGKPIPPATRKQEKRVLGIQKPKHGPRTVVVRSSRGTARSSSPPATAASTSSSISRPSCAGSFPLGQLGHRVSETPIRDVPRMSPLCLINCHMEEPNPDVLLAQVLDGVSNDLFERSEDPADAYTNLEELSVCKSARPGQPPLVVATSSTEAAAICQDVWSAQHAQHLTKMMVKPPGGPDHPTSSIIDRPSPDQLDEIRRKVEAGIDAAPQGCQGLPPQCANWVTAPTLPTPKRRTDFSILSRNIGALRRSGYMHVCTSTQLSSINALPGSLTVKYLVLMATLLGQPILGQAMATNVSTPLPPGSANPRPLFTWHPHAGFQHEMIRIDNTDVRLLLGYFPVIQITLPTSRRRLLRVDRIVDLAELSVLQHNAIRWTNMAVENEAAITTDSFRLISGAGSSVEYLLHHQALSAASCVALAKSKHGRLPVSQLEVSLATEAVPWPQMIWTAPQQVSTKTSGSTFRYGLHLEDRRLLPLEKDSSPCHIYHMVQGSARLISERQIGSHYLWFQDSGPGAYHVYNPWHLTASLSTNGSCAVYVPHTAQTRTPDIFLNRCLVLRNGSLAAVHRQQLHSAVSLQRDRLTAIKGLPTEIRLQNQDHTLGPLSTSGIRLVQPLTSGEEQLVLGSSELALKPGIRAAPLTLQDFRPLSAATSVDPVPTPSALLAVGSTLLSTAGSFVISSLTQEMLTKAMQRILAGGKYRYLDPILLREAIASPDRAAYLSTFNASPDQPYTWNEQQNILLLQNLKSLGHIPQQAAQDQAQLASGLAVVTGAAQALEHFNKEGLKQLEKIALNFLASSDLKVDVEAGALAYVVRSGSIALISYFLSTIDTSPALQTHRLHAMPAFHGKAQGTSTALDLPRFFTLTHQATDVNSSAAQSTCARAITSQEYSAALSEAHSSCFTTTTKPPMLETVYQQGTTRLLQTTSPPGKSMIAFLACTGRPAHRFTLLSEVNVFLVPGTCSLHFTIMHSKLASVARLTAEPGTIQFAWLLSYNTSAYGYQLSAQEEAYIALYSVLGAAVLCLLIGTGVLIKYRHLLPWFQPSLPRSNTYVGLAPTIYHPHLGARSLSDFSSSDDSDKTTAASASRPPAHVRPSSIRDRPPFASYTATVRRGERRKPAPTDIVRPQRPSKEVADPPTEKESVL